MRGQYERIAITWPNFIGHLFFWHYNGAPASFGMGISGVMWTIAIEVQFYIMYALLFPLLNKIGIGRAAFIFLVAEVAYRVFDPVFPGHPAVMSPARFAPMRFGEWLLGAWLAELYVRDKLAVFTPIAALSGVCIIIAGVAIGVRGSWGKYNSTDVQAAIGFFLILGFLIDSESRRRVSLAFHVIGQWLGDRCYSIYLTHATALYFGNAYVYRFITRDPTLRPIFCVIFALMASDIIYRAIEAPSHRLAKKIGSS